MKLLQHEVSSGSSGRAFDAYSGNRGFVPSLGPFLSSDQDLVSGLFEAVNIHRSVCRSQNKAKIK